MQNVLPTAADVAEAHLRIRDWIVETPVLESDALSRRIGARVMFKAECLQRGGSFKIRGALNRLLQLKSAERSAGVVAFSSGNHAQAVAIAAHWLGCRATIVMPQRRPAGEARRHARVTEPRSFSTIASATTARRSPRGWPRSGARRSCRRSTTRT